MRRFLFYFFGQGSIVMCDIFFKYAIGTALVCGTKLPFATFTVFCRPTLKILIGTDGKQT